MQLLMLDAGARRVMPMLKACVNCRGDLINHLPRCKDHFSMSAIAACLPDSHQMTNVLQPAVYKPPAASKVPASPASNIAQNQTVTISC